MWCEDVVRGVEWCEECGVRMSGVERAGVRNGLLLEPGLQDVASAHDTTRRDATQHSVTVHTLAF